MQDGGATGELGELQEYLQALLSDFNSAPQRSIPEHLANKPFDSTASRTWKEHMADEMALKSTFEHMFAPLKHALLPHPQNLMGFPQ